jgi:hypothetical protein
MPELYDLDDIEKQLVEVALIMARSYFPPKLTQTVTVRRGEVACDVCLTAAPLDDAVTIHDDIIIGHKTCADYLIEQVEAELRYHKEHPNGY